MKGKTTKSWPQLPAELIRHIATFYLHDLALTSYSPHTWDAPDLWFSRMIYASVRDSLEFDKIMRVCPQWTRALEHHLFWQQAIHQLDPNDFARRSILANPNPNSNALSKMPLKSLYKQYTDLYHHSCLICRLNNPMSTHGLLTARKLAKSHLGYIGLCDMHDRKQRAFCAVCLRSEREEMVVLENEDEDTFPGFECTCRSCRKEWLWRKALGENAIEAIGGRAFRPADWEARALVEAFVELGEGSIKDVLSLCRDKLWFAKCTRLGEMMKHAEAAEVYNRPQHSQTYTPISLSYLQDEEEEFDEDEEEDENSLLRRSEESVRDLALNDWVRSRILDGFWISPADSYYGLGLASREWVEALHPCPWNTTSPTSSSSSSSSPISPSEPEEKHPNPNTPLAPLPPSHELCEQAFFMHKSTLKTLLLPALRNVIRMVIVQCALGVYKGPGGRDPVSVVNKMTVEDVVRVLREEEGVWFEGVDWVERWRNQRRAESASAASAARRRGPASTTSSEKGSPVSSRSKHSSTTLSSGSGSLGTGSPEASASTVLTTPSPAPSLDFKASPPGEEVFVEDVEAEAEDVDDHEAEAEDELEQLEKQNQLDLEEDFEEQDRIRTLIPISPVLNPPKLLYPIPYVPVSTEGWGKNTMDAFLLAWREVCMPLYACRCTICERAREVAREKAWREAHPNSPLPPRTQLPQTQQLQLQSAQPISSDKRTLKNQNDVRKRVVELEHKLVRLEEEVLEIVGEADEVVLYEDVDLDGIVEEFSFEDEDEASEWSASASRSVSPSPGSDSGKDSIGSTGRKRSSDDSGLEDVGSPPKRLRVLEGPIVRLQEKGEAGARVGKKRGSEELDGDVLEDVRKERGDAGAETQGGKRVRVTPPGDRGVDVGVEG